MLYLEYEKAKANVIRAQVIFENALLEKERLFTMTQPKAITYDKDTVQTSPNGDILDRYVIALEEEKIEEKLRPYRKLLFDRISLLDAKEIFLRKSPDIFDKIYVYRYLDGMSIKGIAKTLNFSKSQIYRKLQSINKRIKKCGKDATICDK